MSQKFSFKYHQVTRLCRMQSQLKPTPLSDILKLRTGPVPPLHLIKAETRSYRTVMSSTSQNPSSAPKKGDFTAAVHKAAVYKVRSHNTHLDVHVPQIRYVFLGRVPNLILSYCSKTWLTMRNIPMDGNADSETCFRSKLQALANRSLDDAALPRVALLGSSGIERFKTTGK